MWYLCVCIKSKKKTLQDFFLDLQLELYLFSQIVLFKNEISWNFFSNNKS